MGVHIVKKIAFLIAVLGFGASVSPAVGIEYCLDKDSKLYRFLGEYSREMQKAHGPDGKGWERLTGALVEQVVKGVAEDHFHVPACRSALERAVDALITQQDIDRMRAKP